MNGSDEMAFTDLFQELNALCNAGNKDLNIHKGSKDNTTIGDITGQLYPPLKYGEAYENIKSEAKVYIFNLSSHMLYYRLISIPKKEFAGCRT